MVRLSEAGEFVSTRVLSLTAIVMTVEFRNHVARLSCILSYSIQWSLESELSDHDTVIRENEMVIRGGCAKYRSIVGFLCRMFRQGLKWCTSGVQRSRADQGPN